MRLENLRQLPSVDGRAPRVALLVYNDFSVDTRVLKTAYSYAAAGAAVRVVAFGTFEGKEPGLTVLDGGIEVERLPLVEARPHAATAGQHGSPGRGPGPRCSPSRLPTIGDGRADRSDDQRRAD